MGDRGTRLLVLGYHNIESTWRFTVRGSGTTKFGRQMRILKRTANVVPLEDALQAIDAGRPLPPRAVAITMDDGYRDNLTSAVPILKQLAIPATIYLVPRFLSGSVTSWWEELAWAIGNARVPVLDFQGQRFKLSDPALRAVAVRSVEATLTRVDHATRIAAVHNLVDALEPAGNYRGEDLFLDWDGARDLVRAGIAIGSHTMEHAILGREGEARQRLDLQESRCTLEHGLGVPIRTLAYPNGAHGDYDETTLRAVRDAGYSHAVTTIRARVGVQTQAYEIPRRMVTVDDSITRFGAGVLYQLAK